MAWYYGTYSCGHEGRTNVVGPTKNRQWIADRKFEGLCPECYEKHLEEEREQRNKIAVEKAKEMELPELTGSEKQENFKDFYRCLFYHIGRIAPETCYVEVGKEYLAEFLLEMKSIFKYVTFYNSTYYHKKENLCYVIRGSKKFKKPKLDYLDEENIIEWICKNEDYECIGDLCMGLGLVGLNAYRNGKRFVGTELNHKRLSVLIEKISVEGKQHGR